jgi:hypothetical protein
VAIPFGIVIGRWSAPSGRVLKSDSGWKDGSFGANYDSNWAQNGCVFPLWPHWGYAKTG